MLGAAASGLQSSDVLAEAYDVALLDLDGVVYVGEQAVPHAADALARARTHGMRLAFVTNNASRTPEVVARHLTSLGIAARPDEVVTSAQAAARLLAERLPAGSAVLVVGGPGLVDAVRAEGLAPVTAADPTPAAVVQGYGPDVDWRALAEAAHAVNAGALWVASNTDRTIPTPRGIAPGNGTLVAAVRAAVDRDPLVAGKPELPLHRESVRRSAARRPLVVGDRLDTDVEGARRGGVDSLLVLTGVTTPVDLVLAPEPLRPSYVGRDLGALLAPHPQVTGVAGVASCGGWSAAAADGRLRVDPPSSPSPDVPRREDDGPAARRGGLVTGAGPDGGPDWLSGVRAACAAAWSADEPLDRQQVADVLAPFVSPAGGPP